MYKAIIFDLDGVIVNTAHFHYLAWNRLAQLWGGQITHEQNEELKGITRMRSLEIIAEWCSKQLTQEEKIQHAHDKNKWYLEYVDKMDEADILPGVKQFLIELKLNKVPVALASASKNAERVLKHINLFEFFDVIADGNSVNESKPDPAIFSYAIKKLGLHPADCIVFEDAPAGLEAALAIGCTTIGVGLPEALIKAHHVIPDFTHFNLNTLNHILATIKSV